MLPMRPCAACGFEHPEQVVICPSTQQVTGVAVLGGRYRLDSLIAVGGIGAVYDARALHIDRRVAVKRLLPTYTSDPEVVRRFQREARAAGRIEHPNVVEVLDFGVGEDGVPFLVMEFLEGDTLAGRIERSAGQRLTYEELLPLMLDVLEALAHAHSRSIVHRDLKPENIFLAHQANGQMVVKLVDLGISKAIGSTSQAITQSGSALGTPHYMAPEQLRGEKDVDGRVDLYALGIVMYRALSGAFPFDGRTFEHLVTRILDGTCAPLTSVVPGIPVGVSDAVAWAMHKDRDQRAPTAEALSDALAPFAPLPTRGTTHPRVPAAGGARGSALPSVSPSAPSVPGPRPSATPVSAPAPDVTTTKRPSAGVRPEPFRIDSTAELQASATLPVVAASTGSTTPRRRGWVWIPVVAFLLAGGAVGAYFALRGGGDARPPEHPPTGGLAGSLRADPPAVASDATAGDVPAVVTDAGEAAAGDAATSPAPTDAGAALPLPVAADAAAAPLDTVDASRPEAAARDAVADDAPDRAARDSVPPPADVASPPRDVAPPPVDAAPPPVDVVPPPEEATAASPDAGPAQPSVAEVAAVFVRLAGLVPRCAEGEGAGQFKVTARVRGTDGRVRDVTVETGFSEQARSCVQNLVAGLSFPPFGDETASFEHTFAVSGDTDAGTADSGVPSNDDIRRRLRRAQRAALACLEGTEGAVELLVHIDGVAQRATLQAIDGDVTPEQESCLQHVVETTEVPAYPGALTVPMRVR
ncbi:MAG: protein kinase [Deltaproteobacteria bacterium]|nr:protein kinase [Deltaproteobacteria bacterium]